MPEHCPGEEDHLRISQQGGSWETIQSQGELGNEPVWDVRGQEGPHQGGVSSPWDAIWLPVCLHVPVVVGTQSSQREMTRINDVLCI